MDTTQEVDAPETGATSRPRDGGYERLPNKRESLHGLTAAEVLEQRRRYGENVLPTKKGPSAWSVFFSQFKSPLVYIILAAAAVSLVVGEYGDFAIIMAVVVIDAVLGFIQEYRAQQTYTALRSLLKPTTTVIRDGARQEIDLQELVPGDLVVLNAGERVPGDGEIVESTKLAVDEAILTGESEPVSKNLDQKQVYMDAPGTGAESRGEQVYMDAPGTGAESRGEQVYMDAPGTGAESRGEQVYMDAPGTGAESRGKQVYMGTTVVTGRGLMHVTRTGSSTELGQIATSLQEYAPEETPLQVRLRAFSRALTRLVILVTVAILAVGLLSGRPFLEMLRVSIILAIAAVPEGLLIAVTVILVVGMRKILKRNGLVKKLLAVETLGSVTVICTDKTGTLTEGRMRVTHADLVDQQRAVESMVLCNDLEGPVDVALWEYVRTHGSLDPQELVNRAERLNEELFSSETKFMITANRTDGQYNHYLKGAPEIVLDMCHIAPAERTHILAQVEQWGSEGLRLLGLAYRPQGALEDHTGYTWVGLVAMEDPIREGVRESIAVAQRAGIQIKMITGDYRRTAERIAASIGLPVSDERVLEGEELATLDDQQLEERVGNTVVFSRIRPQDKLRIVRALQARGEITAMIGDGVNDAPALQRANIGVVVGSATDVAKETADLILLDSNFRTVVAAVEEGRVVFENIRKVVAYTLSNSFAEVLTIFGAMVLGWPAPLMVAQILWIHLICDGPSDIVLGFEPKEEGIMDERPKPIHEPVLNRLGLSLIGVISIASTLVALVFFGHYYTLHHNPMEGRSYAFASFAVNSMIYIFAYRSMRRSIFHSGSLSRNKPLVVAVLAGLLLAIGAFLVPAIRNLLGIVPLSLQQWGVVFGVALSLIAVVEIGKLFSNRLRNSHVVRVSQS